jgi:hypothetical protein
MSNNSRILHKSIGISHLLEFAALPQHGEELNEIEFLGIWYARLIINQNIVLVIRLLCFEGMTSSIWYLSPPPGTPELTASLSLRELRRHL